ncbi:Transcription factorfungi [Penicillium lividum]|nr:Transcription factorfungi [Penicillium lividum]
MISSIPGISDVLMNCKQLARDIKSQRPSRGPLPAGIHQTFPDPAVMEQLVGLYFDSFESCYRILHLPSFRVEYDAYVRDPSAAKTSFVAKLLLVMSNAATLLEDTRLKQELRAKARSWIHVAQGWLSAPIEKDRLSVDGLQVYCLLLLARQVNLVGADLVWISAGSLMHMAIQMGFHQDPDHLGGMSRLQKEIRRRLWYTILEMNIQAALDSGMRPMVTAADFDTRPPSDISDEDLDNVIQGASPENPGGSIPTRASFHCLLASSVLLRLEATKFINALQEEPSYDRVVRLGEELALVCRNATVSIDHHKRVAKDLWPTEFPYSCCDHFHRRFLLCLHLPYAAKVAHNAMYSYSSKAGLEAALALVSLLDDTTYRRLLLVGGGMFRDILTRGAILVFLELMTQLENDGSSFVKKRNQARREPLLKDARNIVEYVKDRIWHGETNVKGYVFVSMAMGQVDAMISDTSTKDAIVKSASEALLVCHDILKSTATNLLSTVNKGADVTYEIGSNSMAIPSVDDLDFDFMNDGNIDFELAGSWFIRQWDDEARL